MENIIYKGYKYALDLNNKQKNHFDQVFGCCRSVYNLALETKLYAYNNQKINLSAYDLINQLSKLKDICPYMYDIANAPLQQSILNMGDAYNKFFNDGAGFPKFKSKYDEQTCKYVQINNCLKVDFTKHKMQIPKLGWVNFHRDRHFYGVIKSITISRNSAGEYFASILIDTKVNFPNKPEIKKETAIGIDVGLTTYTTDSRGIKTKNPKYYREIEKDIKYNNRKLSKKKKGSKRKIKLQKQTNKLSIKLSNKQKDFSHKLSTSYIKDSKNQTIFIEDLNIQGMMKNHKLSKAIQYAAWGEFFRQLKYKSDWSGKYVLEIGRFIPSTKRCSCCGFINNELTLADREWVCPECKTFHDRDENAAKVIKEEGLDNIDVILNKYNKHKAKPVKKRISVKNKTGAVGAEANVVDVLNRGIIEQEIV